MGSMDCAAIHLIPSLRCEEVVISYNPWQKFYIETYSSTVIITKPIYRSCTTKRGPASTQIIKNLQRDQAYGYYRIELLRIQISLY